MVAVSVNEGDTGSWEGLVVTVNTHSVSSTKVT